MSATYFSWPCRLLVSIHSIEQGAARKAFDSKFDVYTNFNSTITTPSILYLITILLNLKCNTGQKGVLDRIFSGQVIAYAFSFYFLLL